jgi:hypothetical protein
VRAVFFGRFSSDDSPPTIRFRRFSQHDRFNPGMIVSQADADTADAALLPSLKRETSGLGPHEMEG